MADELHTWEGFNREAPGGLAAGFYPSMPQGHGLISNGNRCMTACDMGGGVDIAGVYVQNPADLRALGEHLLMLADRLASRV